MKRENPFVLIIIIVDYSLIDVNNDKPYTAIYYTVNKNFLCAIVKF